MRRPFVIALSLFTVLTLAGEAHGQSQRWQEVPVVEDDDVSVRLRVRNAATLADTSWFVMEFENRSAAPLAFQRATYQIQAVWSDPGRGKVLGRSMVSAGNLRTLFPNAGLTSDPLAPGEIFMFRHAISADISSRLGMAPPRGLHVDYTLHMNLACADGCRLQTPREGITLSSAWLPPNEYGIGVLRQRIVDALAADQGGEPQVIAQLLRTPRISTFATPERVVEALRDRAPDDAVRDAILLFATERLIEDPVVLSFFTDRLERRDATVVYDLDRSGFWDESFLPALVDIAVNDRNHRRATLELLHAHRETWRDNGEITAQLAAAVREDAPWIMQPSAELSEAELRLWTGPVRDLALCNDAIAIRWLMPALNDQRVLVDSETLSVNQQVAPIRVCDHALESLLICLEGSSDAAYEQFGIAPVGAAASHPGQELVTRDAIIASMRRQFDVFFTQVEP